MTWKYALIVSTLTEDMHIEHIISSTVATIRLLLLNISIIKFLHFTIDENVERRINSNPYFIFFIWFLFSQIFIFTKCVHDRSRAQPNCRVFDATFLQNVCGEMWNTAWVSILNLSLAEDKLEIILARMCAHGSCWGLGSVRKFPAGAAPPSC